MKIKKKWIKDHKKEIIVGIAATGATAAYFLLMNESVEKLKGHFGISFSFGDRDGMYLPYRGDTSYTNITLRNPGFTVADLGKIGEELKNRIPSLKDETQIGNLIANYTITR